MSNSISILLGAGFSAPMGYPVGNQLNESLLKADDLKIGFHTNGSLVVNEDGTKPDFGYKNSYEVAFDFCCDLIHHFKSTRGYFDYEEFYDFIKYEARNNKDVESLFIKRKIPTAKRVDELINDLPNIYTQLVGYFLRDRDGNRYYDNEGHMGGPTWPGYTGILNCLRHWVEDYIVNVHTLNHDLFFERLDRSDWINGKLCDGYEEPGSPYYGDLTVEGRNYKCRLERYTGSYDKPLRLFKLHGSRDYAIFYKSKGSFLTPERYVKTRRGIGFSDFYKEIQNEKGEYEYDHCWINYHAVFLTGTTSKIERYTEPLLFKILFEHFTHNLEEANMLVIIGYGGKDSEINKMIMTNYDYKTKPTFIIDPYPGKLVKELGKELNARLIVSHLEDVNLGSFK